jgi:transcriptional regulator with XRE-family HTH domain
MCFRMAKKISVKRIADYMGLSPKQVSRYRTDKEYMEKMKELQAIIDEYNARLNK